MTFEELKTKHCNSTSLKGIFYVDLPNGLWLVIDDSGKVTLHYNNEGETHVVSTTIILGTKSYENIDKLLDGLKGE